MPLWSALTDSIKIKAEIIIIYKSNWMIILPLNSGKNKINQGAGILRYLAIRNRNGLTNTESTITGQQNVFH